MDGSNKNALLIVDVQNDFCPGGALAVVEGDRVVPVIRLLIDRWSEAGAPIFATRDWHPPDHCSFEAQGGIWPEHCVAGTEGALFHPELDLPPGATIVDKANRPDREAYSGFEGTDLARRLRNDGVTAVTVCGLATDYCVKHTVLDARRAGFRVSVVEEAIRAVELEPGDATRALEEMHEAGARMIRAAEARPA